MRPRTKTTQPTVLSNAVKQLRELMEMTQEQFAQMLGVTLTTVARWETFRNPNGPMLLKLRAVSSKMADLAAESGRADIQAKFLDLDDLFYSALLQEFPLHRHGLATQIVCGIYDAIEKIQGGHTDEAIELLRETQRVARLLDGMRLRLPEDATAGDVARVFVPDALSGHVNYHAMTEEQKTTETEKVVRRLSRKERKPKT